MYSSSDDLNSQATLVNPEPPLEFIFSSSKPLNSNLLLDGSPRYKIETLDLNQWESDVTDTRTNELVVSVRKLLFLPDYVRFPAKNGGKPLRRSKWLVQSKAKNGHTIWTVRNERGTFVWRMDRVMRLVLSPEGDPETILVHMGVSPEGNLSLIVAKIAEGFVDEILASYICLEVWMNAKGPSGVLVGNKAGASAYMGMTAA